MTAKAKITTIGGVKYPADAVPGEAITWTQVRYFGEQAIREKRAGMVIERAGNGVSYEGGLGELSGYWLWVLHDNEGGPVRVRYWASGKRAGTAARCLCCGEVWGAA